MRLFFFVSLAFLFACEGPIGPVGLNSLINSVGEPAGANCENGGIKTEFGLDLNQNGVLDSDEVTKTTYVCNGLNGSLSLMSVATELPGENCPSGGLKVLSGIDTNNNSILDSQEVISTSFVCNGNNGTGSLINISSESSGSNCENGGVKIQSGEDINADGVLQENEIQITRFVCNGKDGTSDEQIHMMILDLEAVSIGNLSSTTGYEIGELVRFNKGYWQDVDSIVFVTQIRTSNTFYTAYAELYDLTHEVVIDNSTVSTSSTTSVNLRSQNIYEYLPDDEIDLSIRLRIENSEATTWISGKSYLVIYSGGDSNDGGSGNGDALKIGQSYGGGIIFYLDATKEHGLIAAPHDQSSAVWSEGYSITNATGIAVGTGQENTTAIVEALGTGSYAARVCDQLELNGYSDWFLPSRDELRKLYLRKNIVGNFVGLYYWSSTESDFNTAWGQFFVNGETNQSLAKSGNLLSVRAIRAF